MPWVSLQSVIVVFSDHTHLLFMASEPKINVKLLKYANTFELSELYLDDSSITNKKGFGIAVMTFETKVKAIQCKKGCKDQESIQSSTTPDPGYQ